jgi:GDP-D-mannose dehydratase
MLADTAQIRYNVYIHYVTNHYRDYGVNDVGEIVMNSELRLEKCTIITAKRGSMIMSLNSGSKTRLLRMVMACEEASHA